MRNLSFMLVAFAALMTGCGAAQGITLTKDGAPAATIVVSQGALDAKAYVPARNVKATPEQKAKLAAEQLQQYVEKISGAKLPIVGDGAAVQGAAIYVGTSKLTEPFKAKIPSGLTTQRLEEGYLIHSKDDVLVLAGNDVGPYQGTFYAVSEFLNRLGVRWYMPSAMGEVVPHEANIKFAALDFTDKPDFKVRIWSGNLAPELAVDEAMWMLRNKMTLDANAILSVPGDSYLRRYMPDKELIKTHPEYFAKNLDGTINETMVNLTNPEVPKLVAAKVKAEIKATREKDPTFNSLGFAPDDGIPMDLSKETMATSGGFTELVGREGVIQELSISEEWFRFMNKVTEEVVKDYPDFIVTTNGYANRNLPPEGITLNPNMGVMFAAIWSDALHAYDDPKSWQTVLQGQMLKRWCELSKNVFIYNYNYTMIVSGLSPVPIVRRMTRNAPLMKKWGVAGFEDEASFCWMTHGITTMYARTKLYWNANTDMPATMKDYFEKWYGPAAAPAQAYWDALEKCMEDTRMLGHEDRIMPYVYTPELIAELEKACAAEEAAAKAEPYATHVRIDRLTLDHLKEYIALNDAEFHGKFTDAIKHADAMFATRAEVNKVSAFLYYPESRDPAKRYFSGAFYWNLLDRKDHYQKVNDLMTGKTGQLIVMAPTKVKFHLDDADLGRMGRWYDAGYDRGKWRLIDTSAPYYIQGDNMMDDKGVPYRGYMWYVFELDVPRSAIGKPIHIYSPIVDDEAWVWTNGQYTGHREYQESYIRPLVMDMDVTNQVVAGKNTIGVRISTSMNRTQVAEGFQGPLFLYTPVPEKK